MMKCTRWLAPVLLALGVLVAAPACAVRLSSTRGYSQNVSGRAYNEGHQKGFDRGRDDLRHGRSPSYERDNEYRKGDRGYRREDGDHDAYRDAFRQGFSAGYGEAFNPRRDAEDRGRRR